MKRVTIKDIAWHLRLSPSTVSRALSGDQSIRKETKELIYKTADELGYRRNRLAVSLRSGRTNVAGVIVDEMENHAVLYILAGAERYLHSKGINMMVANSESCPEREKANLHMMEGAQVDGLLIACAGDGDNGSEYLNLKRKGVPIVFLNAAPNGIIASSVVFGTDNSEKNYHKLGETGAELLMKMIENPGKGTEKVEI